MSGPAPGDDASVAARLLAVDFLGLGGAWIRAAAGPLRDRWLAQLRALLPADTPWRKLPAGIAESRLLGGLDLAATLAAGRPVAERGLLAEADGGIVVAAMAERLAPEAAAQLAAVLDRQEMLAERDGLALRHPARIGLIALDEGASTDEAVPAALADRLAFHLALDHARGAAAPQQNLPSPPALRGGRGVGERGSAAHETLPDTPGAAPAPWEGTLPPLPNPPPQGTCEVFEGGESDLAAIAAARARLPSITIDDATIEALCGTALALGIVSLRAPLLALRAARAAAALAGRDHVLPDDAALAARLVLAPRATRLPAEADDDKPAPPPPEPDSGDPETAAPKPEELADIVLQAARAAIPPNLLKALIESGRRRGAATTQGKAGLRKHSARRGRPMGARPGLPVRGARLALLDTLRAAAPWQRLRAASPGSRIAVRREDFRIRRFRDRTATTTIFVVDASGSQALARLAEAKGAVELLLAECYVRRDQVALIGFRGQAADLLLPPTGALARARKCLAGLPGGGATPLAAGIDAAAQLADSLRRRGQTPVVVLLTDGRANIARDGTPGRATAEADALAAAQAFRAGGTTAILVDTAPRPSQAARTLADAMGARCLALPLADAGRLAGAVRASLG